MARNSEAELSASQFFPARLSMDSLTKAARHCEACPLFKNATQTVFGAGQLSSPVLLVGEQSGHEEDLKGQPFVGPAGQVLHRALAAVGIDGSETYLTNVVKHFKWFPRGKRRIHEKPSAREIAACLPWLQKEIELVEPHVLVCLGATAAHALLRRDFKVSIERGRLIESPLAPYALATVHPSSILRQPTSRIESVS
jgi:DNA polymerase